MAGEHVPVTRYLVTGNTAYLGHRPGEEFEADLDEAAERRALERGSIEVSRKTAKTKKKEETGDE